ncbi:MAG: hypothetical protein KIS76_10470 [Pyrinomonadaceae bacterium]|nr:hypothetical protein [Pyrinomonadaceae bacterium]
MQSFPDHSFSEIAENAEYSRKYTIGDSEYTALTDVFGDRSPLHVDEGYAIRSGFNERVMHGAILQGFLSHFIGCHFPGKRSLILSVSVDYRLPNYLGDEIEILARVRQKVETGKVVVLGLKFNNLTTGKLSASGKILVSIRDE